MCFQLDQGRPGLSHKLFLNRNLAVELARLEGMSLAAEVRPFRALRKVG